MRIGILTGGGDAPGLNAAIRAVARRAFQLGHHVSGVQNGWAGCLEDGLIREMTAQDVRGILPLGGYVKMVDEREGEVLPADLSRAFNRQNVWRRIAIAMRTLPRPTRAIVSRPPVNSPNRS